MNHNTNNSLWTTNMVRSLNNNESFIFMIFASYFQLPECSTWNNRYSFKVQFHVHWHWQPVFGSMCVKEHTYVFNKSAIEFPNKQIIFHCCSVNRVLGKDKWKMIQFFFSRFGMLSGPQTLFRYSLRKIVFLGCDWKCFECFKQQS